MSITRRTWTDDDGSGTTGTILDDAELQNLYDDFDAWRSSITVTDTGTVNNLSITSGGVEADLVLLNNASDLTINGIVAPASPAKPGKLLVVRSIGAGNAFLAYNSGSASAGNKLINLCSSAVTPLAAGVGYAIYVYQSVSSRWELIGHDQGDVLQASFAAGNFTGSGSMTWTLASGDRVDSGYYLRGRMMEYFFQLATTTVGGTPSTDLRIAAAEFGGFTPTSRGNYTRLAYANDNGSLVEAFAYPDGTYLAIQRTTGANWSAATDTTYVYGRAAFRVL